MSRDECRHRTIDLPAARRGSGDVLKFEWNALRVGDKVLVHEASDPGLRLVAGTVVIVQPRRGGNDIGIRVMPLGETPRVTRPRRLAVHLRPYDPSEPCWRCDLKQAS